MLFTRTTDLVQKLQSRPARSRLEAAIAKLDKYHLLILDDLAYVSKDQAETSVLFELISARYERRSLLITANQPFGDCHRQSSPELAAEIGTAVSVQPAMSDTAAEARSKLGCIEAIH